MSQRGAPRWRADVEAIDGALYAARMTLGATAVIVLALFASSRLFPTGSGDVTSGPMLRAARLSILLVMHCLGIGLYALAVVMGLLGDSLRVLIYSLVPILGQVFWIQSSWWSGAFLTEYAIAFAAWLGFIVLAFVAGAFKERLAPRVIESGVIEDGVKVQE